MIHKKMRDHPFYFAKNSGIIATITKNGSVAKMRRNGADMTRYENQECPVCHKKFTEQDDVVVCPECGTPHHRACWQANGKCFFEAEHASGMNWEKKEEEKEQQETQEDGRKCPKCGANNPQDGIFCQVCGYPLRMAQPEENGENPFFGEYGPIPVNPFTTPFGGVSPEEEIDGVTAKELAVFVGENSFYYVPRIKELKTKDKTVSWNWAACIGGFFYYFNRKMYGIGTALLVLFLAVLAPMFVLSYEIMLKNPTALLEGQLLWSQMNTEGTETLMMICMISRYVYLGVMVLSGLFANRLYTDHIYKKISEVRRRIPEYTPDAADYCNALAVAGRTDRRSVLLVAALLIVLYFAVIFAISALVMSL